MKKSQKSMYQAEKKGAKMPKKAPAKKKSAKKGK